MVAVGEQGGMLESMFQQAADYYEARVDNTIGIALIPLLEPAMMVTLGGLLWPLCWRCICLCFKWAVF